MTEFPTAIESPTWTDTVMSVNPLSVALYEKLYLMRRAEEGIIRYYSQDEMRTPMHMSMGQEAIPAAVCHALESADQVFSSYRSHATFLGKVGDVETFFGELYGKISGTARGKAGSMHLADPQRGHMGSSAIVASNIPVAVGAAFANKYKRNNLISCVFFGDGAVDEGVFWESLNTASLMKLPVLFVCEDNDLAVHTFKKSRHGFPSIADIGRAFNCRVYEAETTDVEKLYELARSAVDAVRKRSIPGFMHLKCYRYLEHVGVNEDFEVGYRPRSEFDRWSKNDSVHMQRSRLLAQGMPEADVLALEVAIDSRIDKSIRLAKEAPLPQAHELYLGVFHED